MKVFNCGVSCANRITYGLVIDAENATDATMLAHAWAITHRLASVEVKTVQVGFSELTPGVRTSMRGLSNGYSTTCTYVPQAEAAARVDYAALEMRVLAHMMDDALKGPAQPAPPQIAAWTDGHGWINLYPRERASGHVEVKTSGRVYKSKADANAAASGNPNNKGRNVPTLLAWITPTTGRKERESDFVKRLAAAKATFPVAAWDYSARSADECSIAAADWFKSTLRDCAGLFSFTNALSMTRDVGVETGVCIIPQGNGWEQTRHKLRRWLTENGISYWTPGDRVSGTCVHWPALRDVLLRP